MGCLPPNSAPTLAHGHKLESKGPKCQFPQNLMTLKPAFLGVKWYHQVQRKPCFSIWKCSPGGKQRHGGKWVKPQQLTVANFSKALILLIRLYSLRNLDILLTMVQNVHRMLRLKVRDLREIFDVGGSNYSDLSSLTSAESEIIHLCSWGVWQRLWLFSLMPISIFP